MRTIPIGDVAKKVVGMVAKEKTKVLVIGLDGATFDLLRPWTREGKLPTLARLMKTGVSGTLASVFPPISSSAWTSFITGKNPGKHGILDFKMRKEGSYDRMFVDTSYVDGKTLWSILSEGGKKVGVAYVPFTPVHKVNGFIIPGIFSPPSIPAYPPTLEKELRKESRDYEITRNCYRYVPTDDDYLRRVTDRSRKVEGITLRLMRKYLCDFFMTTFYYTDQVQHIFWRYLDPQHPAYNSKEEKKYGNAILQFYQNIDKILERILRNVDKRTIIIVMSDHGAGPAHKTVYINHWLMKLKLLKLRETPKRTSCERYIFKQLLRRNIVDLILKANLVKILSKIKPPEFFRNQYSRLLIGSRPTLSDIDWMKTRAYSTGVFGQMFINLVGREPAGIVEPGEEYEELRNFLIKSLYELKDPDNGERVVDEVIKREEVYRGPYTEQAADLFFTMKGMTYCTNIYSEFGPDSNILTEPTTYLTGLSGTHRMNGILIVSGPGIKRDITLENARIIDLAPTILHIMDVPIPSDMDGRVLKEIFEPESDLAEREIKHTEPPKKKITRRKPSKEEEEKIRERLRALGYLD